MVGRIALLQLYAGLGFEASGLSWRAFGANLCFEDRSLFLWSRGNRDKIAYP
jgi:hypothetical protein